MAKEHRVQVIKRNVRYVAVEKWGKVTLSKDGDTVGSAKWKDDQLQDNTAILPDDVVAELERLIREGMDSNWGED